MADRDYNDIKTPPHSVEAEQAVLGGIMLDPGAWERVSEAVVSEDFYRDDHRKIYRAIAKLAGDGQPIDAVTVFEQLERDGEADAIGGLSYLADLAKNTPSAANILSYANILRERALLREMIAAAHEIADTGYFPKGNSANLLLDQAEAKMLAIAEKRSSAETGPRAIGGMLKGVVAHLEEAGKTQGLTGLSTGFEDLDGMTSGLQKGDLVIVAARPSMGKCIVAGSRLLDPRTGALRRIEDCVAAADMTVLALDNAFRLQPRQASQFVDDGIKPVFRVTTASGRRIETTLTHPFLTGNGWRPLAELQVGEAIAVPRALPVFGTSEWPAAQVKALAYFIADGGLTQSSPSFTNTNEAILGDFTEAMADFAGVWCRRLDDAVRTPTIRVVRDETATAQARSAFAERLQRLAGQRALTQRDIANQLGVVPAAVHAWWHGNSMPSPELVPALAVVLDSTPAALIAGDYAVSAHNARNSVAQWLAELGLWGKRAIEKTLPDAVFTLTRAQLALFLSRLFGCDGSVYRQNTELPYPQYAISYATSSEQLARDVQHLLLRFGVLSTLRAKAKHYSDSQATPYELRITQADSVRRFLDEIGLFGKEPAAADVRAVLAGKQPHENTDLLPVSVCDYVLACKGERAWPALFAAKQRDCPAGYNPHLSGQSRRRLSRTRAAEFATLLDDAYLQHLADSDVYWDEIVGIDWAGDKQVYDLTVPELHNFVAEDVLVHNTTFAMNLCENAMMRGEKPVLVFSMEMPAEQLIMRTISSLGSIDFQKVRSGQLDSPDWDRVFSVVAMLKERNNLYIDDTAGLSPLEVRSRARRLHREHGGLSLIMVDYLQLMRGDSAVENRTAEISEISRSLKALAKELKVPLVALSQLNRSLEQRTDKRPVMADLRESGAIEQDADVILCIYRDEVYHKDKPDNKGHAEILIRKQRNGPIGDVRLTFQGRYTRFKNFAPDTGEFY